MHIIQSLLDAFKLFLAFCFNGCLLTVPADVFELCDGHAVSIFQANIVFEVCSKGSGFQWMCSSCSMDVIRMSGWLIVVNLKACCYPICGLPLSDITLVFVQRCLGCLRTFYVKYFHWPTGTTAQRMSTDVLSLSIGCAQVVQWMSC